MRIAASSGNFPEDRPAAEAALAGGRIGLLTIVPDDAPSEGVLPGLESLAGFVREAGYACGTAPAWYIFTGASRFPRIRGLVRGRFLFDPRRVLVVRVPDFPFLDEEGRLLVRPDGGIACYSSVTAGALLLLRRGGLDRSLADNGIDTLYFLPLNRFSLPFPHQRLLAGHYGNGADVSALLFRGEGGPVTTGIYAARRGLFRGGEGVPVRAETARVAALMPGARSAEEIGDRVTEKFRSFPYFIAAGAENRWGLLEDL